MKQQEDVLTKDMFAQRERGRPRKSDAKSTAQRAKEYRARKKAREFNFLRGHRDETA